MLLIKLICAQSSSFASNYASGKLSLPTSSFIKTSAGTLTISGFKSNYDGNPNGFKFGSAYSSSSCVRTVKNCVSWDHSSKGFDNNNSSCTASFTNCMSFNNGYNYYVAPFTFTTWSNVYGFGGKSSDKLPSGKSVTTPSSSSQSSIKSTCTTQANNIKNTCASNKIPGAVSFNVF